MKKAIIILMAVLMILPFAVHAVEAEPTTVNDRSWLHLGYDMESTRFYPHASDVTVNPSTPFELLWNSTDVSMVANNPVDIVTGDINGDGHLELVAAAVASDSVTALSGQGELLWTRNVAADSGVSDMKISPSCLDLCDINTDGAPEVFVGLKKGTASTNLASRILAYDGEGNLLKTIITPNCDAIRGLMCADLDLDGNVEIVAAISAGYPQKPRGIYTYSYATGLELWHYSVGPVPFIDAISDLDDDGDLEIIVGTFAPHNGNSDGGMSDYSSYVVVLDKDGNKLWHKEIGTFQAHSSIADLDNDRIKEIVTFRSQHPHYYPGPNDVYTLNITTGSILNTYSGPGKMGNGWSIADIDNDMKKEVIYAGGDDILRVLDHNMNVIDSKYIDVNEEGERRIHGPASVIPTSDLNGDGQVEIILHTWGRLAVLDSTLGELWNYTGLCINTIVSDVMAGGTNEVILAADGELLVLSCPLEQLVATIESWNLPEGTESSLTAKLDAAVHLLNKGNENGAIHKLMDFINNVEAQRGKKLTDEQADYLVEEAQRIINLIQE